MTNPKLVILTRRLLGEWDIGIAVQYVAQQFPLAAETINLG